MMNYDNESVDTIIVVTFVTIKVTQNIDCEIPLQKSRIYKSSFENYMKINIA